MNTSELFCQVCVDWIGGLDSHPAEQYVASQITLQWVHHFKQDISVLNTRKYRQIERQLRWKDTPQHIMKGDFCFISSDWMVEWEMFVEGWKTTRPSLLIDQTQLLSLVVGLNQEGTNPFYLHSNGSVMIISSQTWDYLSRHYNVKGKKITEEHLCPVENYSSIIQRITYWKKRALNFAR
ncbi:hypothetical protein HPULCUR_003926 [Helicostylum pulchrum]|uniref:DUSP domain-containing protein n=1 Tax=Helicostylum pulchrum TaxID=562976 RepID=A0ABP9XUQ8_9FUNG